MRIPHTDPDPPKSMPVGYAKEEGLTWETFHPELKQGGQVAPLHRNDPNVHWKRVANNIHDHRTRFTQHNQRGGNPRCSTIDRSAVLAVYQEALSKIERTSKTESCTIFLEVRQKVETILDLRTAEPNDAVFTAKNTFLSPLEPQYAQPRLNYYNREPTMDEDSYHYAGAARLREWRKEGWPSVYPAKAVQRERRERKERRREGRKMLRETAAEGLVRAYERDSVEWGEEVDAEPARPWR